jgi:hypothetical protein
MAGLKFLSGEDTEAKYQFYGLMIFLLLVYWLAARFILFFNIPLNIIELIFYAGIIGLLFYLISFAPLKKKNKAQDRVQALDYADSMIRRGKKRPDDLMLPFKEVYELDIDFEDNGSLTAKLSSKTYKAHHISYLQAQITPNVSEVETESINAKDLNSLLEMIAPKLLELRNEGKLDNLVLSEENEKKMKRKKSSQDKESENFEEEIDLDVKKWDIKNVKKEDVESLKKLNIYWVILDSAQNYEGEKNTWDELYIIIPHYSYQKALATGKGRGFYKGWSVALKECFCFWLHLWDLTRNIQVLYLAFSENFDKPYLEPLKNLKAEAYAFLQLKVMEVYMNDLEVKPENLKKMVGHYREKAHSLGQTLSDVVQDEAATNIVFSKFMKNPAQQRLLSEIERYRRRFMLALSGIAIAALSLGIIIAIIL